MIMQFRGAYRVFIVIATAISLRFDRLKQPEMKGGRDMDESSVEEYAGVRPVPQPTPEKNGPTSPSSPPFALKAWRKIQRFSSVVRTAITGPQHCQKKKECMESAKKTSTDETESRGRFYLHEDAPLLSEKVENAR